MNIRSVLFVQGVLLVAIGLFMIFPVFFSFYYHDNDSFSLVLSAFISLSVGGILWIVFRHHRDLNIRDSFAVVTFGWILAAAFGALPFVLSGAIPSYTNAFFETMSGFTTTGASILEEIETLPHGILFWRSLTHWLGGMGIIVLSLVILPALGVGGMQLFKAEIPGPVPDKLAPRVQRTAALLWGVYVVISAAETVFLLLGGMNLFDALCHTFGTMATGGFSTKNASVGHFQSAYIDYVIIVFMFLAGANFSLHFYGLRGRLRNYWKSEEFRFYVAIMVFFTLFLTFDNWITFFPNLLQSLRYSLFQVVSISTTTGFATADFENWSSSAQFILLFLMFVGGCAGSTGGSVKVLRVMIFLKMGRSELKKLLHPKAVVPVRVDGKAVPPAVVVNVLGFLFLYLALFVAATIIMTMMDLDFITAVSSVAATLGNIGPGLGDVGPTDNYLHIPIAGKWLLSFLMLAGRLEIYTVLVLLTREFWE